MAVGAYVYDNGYSVYSYYSDGNTVADSGFFNVDVRMRSLLFRSTSTGTWNGKAVIYNNAGTLIASSAAQNVTVASTTTTYEVALTTPVTLTAGQQYKIGFYNVSGGACCPSVRNAPSTTSRASSPAYANWTRNQCYYIGADASPTVTNVYEMVGGFTFDAPNVIPTASALAPNLTNKDNRTTSRFSWTYADTESNTQTQYEISYRLKGSTGAYTTVTNTSANNYHDFAANTFTLGSEYEWLLRVNDGVAGWSAYYSAEFLAGASYWTTPSAVATATQSGSVATTSLTPGSYYVQVKTADAVDFGPWSTSLTTVVNPTNNVWVRQGGIWVLGSTAKQVKQAGAWKSVAPTVKISVAGPVTVTGGTVTYSGSDTIRTFTSSGTLTVTGGTIAAATVLVVGGGGGGGGFGGGGAGGFLTGTENLTGSMSVTVGAGGAGAAAGSNKGTNGGSSIFGTRTALGGGGGGAFDNTNLNGLVGGSGGGAGTDGGGNAYTSGTAGAGTAGQGNNGGLAVNGATASGAGGGAGAVGGSGAGGTGGSGGAGLASSISGSSVTYAGGGGASGQTAAGTGGSGGGGNGGIGSGGIRTAGAANTGGGGGGGYNTGAPAGGSGIVIVRYPTP